MTEKMYKEDEVFDKEITQEEKAYPVTKALGDMGQLWKLITNKLGHEDKICFMCKKTLEEKEDFDIIEVPHNKTDKGLIAFVAVCKTCQSDD